MDIKIVKGDITTANVDAIVNAANSGLLEGGGVCGAIFKASGNRELLQRECNALSPCMEGEAVITSGYNLKAKYIIHAVGPIYKGDTDAMKLHSAYVSSLALADKHGLKSVAFPSISTGIYGYPLDKAVIVALNAVRLYTYDSVKEVYFYCFDDATYNAFNDRLARKSILYRGAKATDKKEIIDAIKQAIALPYVSDLYSFLLDYIGAPEKPYYEYFESTNVDEEMSCIGEASFDKLKALLLLIIREDHFSDTLFSRYKEGTIHKVLYAMLKAF